MNLKLYRKLSILCVLTIGLFFAASASKSSAVATSCCDDCLDAFNYCAGTYCATSDRKCLEDICIPEYEFCKSNCPTHCP
jgi:hypothetical protein